MSATTGGSGTVLLAPGCASMTVPWVLFTNYGARGDAFAAAVHRLRQTTEEEA
ncbi:MAG TPA: hypothetical protein VHO29_18365 [Marmoricola sp.]|nr:hypothetical protein [Marmoricola sp.]